MTSQTATLRGMRVAAWTAKALVVLLLMVIPVPIGELINRMAGRRKRAVAAQLKRDAESRTSVTTLLCGSKAALTSRPSQFPPRGFWPTP